MMKKICLTIFIIIFLSLIFVNSLLEIDPETGVPREIRKIEDKNLSYLETEFTKILEKNKFFVNYINPILVFYNNYLAFIFNPLFNILIGVEPTISVLFILTFFLWIVFLVYIKRTIELTLFFVFSSVVHYLIIFIIIVLISFGVITLSVENYFKILLILLFILIFPILISFLIQAKKTLESEKFQKILNYTFFILSLILLSFFHIPKSIIEFVIKILNIKNSSWWIQLIEVILILAVFLLLIFLSKALAQSIKNSFKKRKEIRLRREIRDLREEIRDIKKDIRKEFPVSNVFPKNKTNSKILLEKYQFQRKNKKIDIKDKTLKNMNNINTQFFEKKEIFKEKDNEILKTKNENINTELFKNKDKKLKFFNF